ncbi:virulence-associated protein E [Sphingomonas paeninsulae]|uniref:Virulence-associated protein E n=1 Tax=Sphingomonas paeninsulae TaxID=2319844 RepID=A0A494THT8_SPHPE|nr:CHC2 zinc finger domain-containing protein [Sphingomonas paeninsulae]AYJ86892.1 virulence-associated protein E [Sphingomonas paeninsulae]
MRIDLDTIRAAHSLTSVAGAVVKLKRAGNEMAGCCPFHADKSPSFTIYSGGQRGHCFGCGWTGDVLDFVMKLHGVSLPEAADMLTGGNLPVVQVAPIVRNRPQKDERDTTAEALAIWNEAVPITGTPAEVYLRRRSITVALPPCLRFACIRYGWGSILHPALIAAITSPAGDLIGIQRTYLTEDGGKAPFDKVKLSLGRVRGGAIQLGAATASMLVTEGLEDGLTLFQVLGRSVWVSAGTSMLPAIEFPPIVRAVVIGADGDAPGEAAAQKAAEAYSLAGCIVRIMRPAAPHKDFNAEAMAVNL